MTSDKLLNKLEENEPELATCQEEECVICINAKATMQTSPCGHQVVCRKCFVKTIQIAVSQRLLPLRCVICRAKILRLKTGPILPSSASGYSVNSRSSSVPQSDSLYSVSSGNSSISSTSCSSESSAGCRSAGGGGTAACCISGHCLGGAYPRQPTGALRRSQQHAMKMKLQEYCRSDKNGHPVNRLPPIKEISTASPTHNAPPPASTRIRCAQKIVTQLETGRISTSSRKGKYKYEKLPQQDEEDPVVAPPNSTTPAASASNSASSSGSTSSSSKAPCESTASTSKDAVKPKEKQRWWGDRKHKERTKSEERIDNKKNEITEKHMEMKHKLFLNELKRDEKNAKKEQKGKCKDGAIKENKV
ncbi:mediator of RNA polymerase II transcription subunit 1 isoform X2 [Atheta coriaria]|uniref:mediator of RNA polymerase II transcription subunit 1 isoform X2 n=1 Tax=Dalotia coriaria TaxID=877792 RepID=UPI0031F43947